MANFAILVAQLLKVLKGMINELWQLCLFDLAVQCPDFSVEGGTVSGLPAHYPDSVDVACDPGYDTVDPTVLSCTGTGSWDLSPPVCSSMYITQIDITKCLSHCNDKFSINLKIQIIILGAKKLHCYLFYNGNKWETIPDNAPLLPFD